MGWRYDNSSAVLKSSLRILAGSFRSNRTYQFRVSMTNRRNSSIQVYGNALVSIEGTYTPLIVIG